MRSFYEAEGFSAPTEKLELPDNILLLATHGSRLVPEPRYGESFKLSTEMSHPIFGEARLKDYSDFGTGLIQEHFHLSHIVTPPLYGRIAGDPNRKLSTSETGDIGIEKGKETFRTHNMSGLIPVWDETFMPSKLSKHIWLDENYISYYEKITASIMDKASALDGELLVIDLHDTGDVSLMQNGEIEPNQKRLKEFNRSTFWEAVLSDYDGLTAKDFVMNGLFEATKNVYEQEGILKDNDDILINVPYKGGNVTQYIGLELPKIFDKWGLNDYSKKINAIQFEIPRHRFMPDEQFQKIDPEMIAKEAKRLQKILTLASTALRS